MSITYLEAIREAQAKALADDPRVFIYGQDVGAFGGVGGGPQLRLSDRLCRSGKQCAGLADKEPPIAQRHEVLCVACGQNRQCGQE